MASNANTHVSLAKVAEYVEALTLDPRSKVFVPLSEIYRQASMHDAAQSVLVKGIKHNPDYAPGYVALGRTLVARGMTEKGEKAFRKALQLDPGNLPALKAVLRLRWENGDAPGARTAAEAVCRVKPGDGEAEKILQRLAERDEKESTSVSSGGRDRGSAAKPKKREGEEPIKTATLADIYVRQGLFQKALNLYRQILVRDPDNEDVKRKALAARKRLAEQSGQNEPESSARDQATSTASDAGGAEQAASTAKVDTGETEPAPEPTEESTLRTLEGWLDSIRQRREHVQ